MPRLDLILLPLLGGYIFVITFHLTKYYHLRLEKERLIYNSLAFAVILAFITYLIDYLILRSSFVLDLCFIRTKPIYYYRSVVSRFIDDLLIGNVVKGLKHCIFMFLIAYPLARFLNLFFSKELAFDFTITRWGNQLERLIWFSLTEKKDEDKLLMITTKSNKVYIGYVSKLSEPLGQVYVTILPNFSGYRDKETLQLKLTTTYTDIIEKYVLDNREAEIGEKLGVVLPLNEILIASKFDNEIFGRFNSSIDNSRKENKYLRMLCDFLKKI